MWQHCCGRAQVVILEAEAGRTATPAILAAHGIPFDRSPDLRDEEKAAA